MGGKLRILLAAASIVAVVLITMLATTGSAGTVLRFTVVERATTDTVIDTDASGTDTTGDLLTFHNRLYKGGDVVGRDLGSCIRVTVGRSWHCAWTNVLEGGTIAVEGPFYDSSDSTLAVTGGTGVYRRATGQMVLHALNDAGTKYSFSFWVKVVG